MSEEKKNLIEIPYDIGVEMWGKELMEIFTCGACQKKIEQYFNKVFGEDVPKE